MVQTNKKKVTALLFLGVITLILVVVGATYAYFTAQGGGGANIDTNVTTSTTDFLSFSFGSEINIYATEENFGVDMGSISDSTTAQALLRANNATNTATATYNIYLIIESNDFIYTTSNQTPEILLKVTDPNGMEVENITGLVHYEDGFDITTRTGGFLLVPDYEISATDAETIQDWNIEVTFVNLDSDQNANTGKTLSGRLYLTQDKMSSYELTEVNSINTTVTYNSVTVTPQITQGSAAIDKYYYGIEKNTETMAYNKANKLTKLSNTLAAIEDIEFIETDDTSYTFSNLDPNSSYTVYSYTVDENKIKSNVYSTTVTTGTYGAPTIDSVNHSVTLNSISLTVNASNGSNEIVKYMYSKDNGASWEESTSNTYTFSGLTDTTQYNIKVKVVDSEGIESTEYYEAITTEVYILPVVSSVNAETTWNSITLTPSGTNGTNTIDHYEYSIDSGAYQTSNVFSNLTDNTNYSIKVKAIDTVGRESNVYEMNVITDTYKLPTISVSTSATANSITINVDVTPGDGTIVSYHYSRDDGSNYKTSNSNNYTFNDLTAGTTYYLKVYVTDSNGRTSSIYVSNITTEVITLAGYIVNNVYTEDGVNGLYYHDGIGTYTNAGQEAGDNSYRYAGANPNNYVCFGSDESTCPAENVYRIIGVFDGSVKLIKNDSIGISNWNSSNNTWNSSSKPSIYQYLNTTYYSSLNTDLQKLILHYNWQVGGGNASYLRNTPKTAYNYEIGLNQNGYEESMYIGLMHVSDYGYAASPENWTTLLSNYNSAASNNWLVSYADEWTISSDTSSTISAFIVDLNGIIGTYFVTDEYEVRPSFYLQSTALYSSGDGTQEKPYRIA